MTIVANGSPVSAVIFNGVSCEKVYMNGVIVFELEATLTIGYDGSNNYGLVGAGHLSSASVIGYSGTVIELQWDGHDYDAIAWIRLSAAPYPSSVRATIGATVIDFNLNSEGRGVKIFAVNPLPKSGTVKVKFEVIA